MSFSDQVVCVTGASRGIGRAIAQAFAKENAGVIINYHTNQRLAEELKAEIAGSGTGAIEIYQANVTSSKEVAGLFAFIKEKYGRLDVLVNNAGITRDQYLMLTKDEIWEEVIQTNLTSAFYCIKRACRLMIDQRKGAILNIASTGGIIGIPAQTHYAASKAGMIGLTRALAKELAGNNITVNSLAPGFIETDMLAKIPERMRREYLEMIPLKRFGKCEEVANLALFLAGSKARYITGQTFVIDGGLTS